MDTVTQIKQKLNIVDVVGRYVELKKSGRNYKAPCPFHNENSPSFMVSQDLQIYKCFGCGESGDMFSFVQKMEGVDFATALEQLAEKAGVKIEKANYDPNAEKKKRIFEINELTTTFFTHLLLKHQAGKDALKYLKEKRKLNQDIIEKFRIGYAPDDWEILYKFLSKKGFSDEDLENSGTVIKKRDGNGYIDKFRNRVMFPLIDTQDKVVGFTGRALGEQSPKYLNTQETLVFYKSSFIYGLNFAKSSIKHNGAVFVEGQMDVISAFQAGINNVVCSSGTSLSNTQLTILSRYTKDLTLCFDSDTAGQTATLRAIEIAETVGLNVKTAIIPEDVTDLDELIKKDSKRAQILLTEPVPVYDYYLSAALKKFDKHTAIGKRNIMETIAPKFAKIRSTVVLDHYINQLEGELDISKQVIKELIEKNEKADYDKLVVDSKIKDSELNKSKITTEEHIIALLYNVELETSQSILYKLAKKDFTDDNIQDLFIKLKAYVLGRKRKFDIKYFTNKLEGEIKQKAEEIHLLDLGSLAGNELALEKELNTTFKRLKRETVNRELKEIQEELKEAELANDTERLEYLSQKVYKISKLKKQYE